MADSHYFEIVNAPHINQKVSNFDEIWCPKDGRHFTEILLFQKSVLAITQQWIILFWSSHTFAPYCESVV